MNHHRLFTGRKGQSAIEYLMTYGWMLLVVAIVGGAIFTTVNNQRQQCSGEVPSSLAAGQNGGFGVTEFAVTGSNVQAVVENQGTEEVTNVEATLGSTAADENPVTTIGVGSSQTFTFSVSPDSSCTEAQLNVTFDQSGISDQVMTGNVTAEMSTP